MKTNDEIAMTSAIAALIDELIFNGVTKDNVVEVWSEYETTN